MPETLAVQPYDVHNQLLVSNVHPPDWDNPEPVGRYNLVVLGAGTAGLVSAAGAAGLGARVALVEREFMGGDCLNVGCVPSKALIAAARVAATVRNAGEYGVEVPPGTRVDFAAVMKRMRRLRASLSPTDSAARFRGLGVDVFLGPGKFTGPDTVEVAGKTLRFRRAVIATGARASTLPIPGLADAGYLTNETVFSLTELPRRLAVIGAGPIGCELAQAFARFGSEVTVLQRAPQVLPKEDRDAAGLVEQSLVRDGIRFVFDCNIQGVQQQNGDRVLQIESRGQKSEVRADAILVGVGRTPNVEGLNLEAAGVTYDAKQGVHVNDRLQTSNPKIYAAGDICSRYKFTHLSDAHARIVIQNALFFGRAKASGNVAIYLDEQSGQLPGRNLDVYAADLERIEVLEGPQGTLFGAGAQAGVIRYITNKPKLNVTEGSVTGGYGLTAGGDPNSEVTGVLNVPLIPGTLAVRGVVYNDSRGGYINNVPATFTRNAATDLGIHYANYATACSTGSPSGGIRPGGNSNATAFGVPPGAPAINNNALAKNAINPVTYQGVRVSALWNINDEWNALITQSYQNMDAEGVFYQMPTSSDGAPLPRQSVTLFNNSYNKDKFENTAWTINGRIGALRAVYAGSYLVRNVSTVQDYTNYARGLYADYYQCHGADPANGLASTCFSPSSIWNEIERNTHQSHEIRLSTPDEWRLRGIAGVFWEDLRIYDQLNWDYKTMPSCTATVTVGCLTDIGPIPTASVNNPALVRPGVAFFNDVQRGYKQRAFFTSLDFNIVPKLLTVTAGTRYYHFDNDEKGAESGSFSCYQAGLPPCLTSAATVDLGTENLQTTYKGFKSRANLTWHILPDVFAYYTWSQGFRAGAFNRSFACYLKDANGVPQYCNPLPYESDNLTNNELGWKTELLDRRLQWNGAVYQEDWKNVQVSFFDPGVLGNVGFNTNGPDYRIRGVETSIIAVLTEGLTAQGGASWTSSEQTNSPFLIDNNHGQLPGVPASPNLGKPILTGQNTAGQLVSVQNPYGPPGSPSSFAPPFQFNTRLRYQWAMNSYKLFAQAGVTHTAHSFTQSGSNPVLSAGSNISTNQLRFENPAYTEYDASFGVGKDAWTAEVYGLNITNVIASAFTSDAQFTLQEAITRPRVLGLRVGYRF